jgi:uncharacterized protein YneF (UPF0154 family)
MEEIKAQEGFIKESLYRIGFWFLIIFLIGFISGVFFAQKMIIEKRLADSVKLKGIVIESVVYDLKERL